MPHLTSQYRFPALGLGLLVSATLAACSDNNTSPPTPFDMAGQSDLPSGSVTLAGVMPTVGPLAGGTQITITGTGFATGAKVYVSGVLASAVTVVSSQQITATIPAAPGGAVGLVEIAVENPDGARVMRSDLFGYARVILKFDQAVSKTVGTRPYALAAADVNKDGGPELIVANSGSASISILHNNLGFDQNGGPYGSCATPTALTTGDFNGDNNVDIAVGCSTADGKDVGILRGAGNGAFALPDITAVGATVTGIAARELNGDGKLDLVVAVRSMNKVVSLTNSSIMAGQVTFATAASYDVGTEPAALLYTDLDLDGKLDAATVNLKSNDISVLKGSSGAMFTAPAKSYAVQNEPIAIAAGLLSGGARPDLLVANSKSNSVSFLRAKTDGTFETAVQIPVGKQPFGVAIADIDGDGKRDLISANSGADNVSIHLGRGDGTFEPMQLLTVGSQPFAVVAADLNSDGQIDLATVNYNGGTVSILYNRTR